MATESKFNMGFLRSRYGMIRIAELLIAICAIISMGSGYYCGHSGKYSFYELVSVWSLILVIVFLVMMIFKFDEYCIGRINMPVTFSLTRKSGIYYIYGVDHTQLKFLYPFPFLFLINDAIVTLFYFIASILLFITIGACDWGKVARIVASIFGVLNMLCFGISTLEDYRWFRTGAAPFELSQTTPTSAQPA